MINLYIYLVVAVIIFEMALNPVTTFRGIKADAKAGDYWGMIGHSFSGTLELFAALTLIAGVWGLFISKYNPTVATTTPQTQIMTNSPGGMQAGGDINITKTVAPPLITTSTYTIQTSSYNASTGRYNMTAIVRVFVTTGTKIDGAVQYQKFLICSSSYIPNTYSTDLGRSIDGVTLDEADVLEICTSTLPILPDDGVFFRYVSPQS